MAVMADKGGKPAPAPAGSGSRKLAQAALNADVTVEQVDTILEGLGETLHRPEQLDRQPRRDPGAVQRHHQPHQRAGAAAQRGGRPAGRHRRPRRTHRRHRRSGDGTAGGDRIRGARCDQHGAPNHRALVPDSLPTPPPPVAEGTGLPWDVPVDDAVAAIAAARARHGDTFAVRQRRRPLPVHVLPRRRRVVLRAARGEGEQGRRRLSDAAAQASRRDLRRQAHPADVAVPPRRRRVVSGQSRTGAGPDRRRTRVPRAPSTFSTSPAGSGTGWDWRRGRDRARPRATRSNGWCGVRHPGRLRRVRASRRDGRRRRVGQARRAGGARRRRRASSKQRCTGWIPARSADNALFGRIVDAWSSEPATVRVRGIALDVALIHIASMSNLMAALGWAMVDLLEHPAELDARGRRRRRPGAALRPGEHPAGAALDHVAGGAGAGRPRHRRRDATGCPPAGPSPPCCRC